MEIKRGLKVHNFDRLFGGTLETRSWFYRHVKCWFLFSYFYDIGDCVIIGICAMRLYFIIGTKSKHIQKVQGSTNVTIFFIEASRNYFLLEGSSCLLMIQHAPQPLQEWPHSIVVTLYCFLQFFILNIIVCLREREMSRILPGTTSWHSFVCGCKDQDDNTQTNRNRSTKTQVF